MPPTYYTPEEIADMLKVSTEYVYRLTSKGTMPSFKMGNKTRISDDDLRTYIEQQRTRSSFIKSRAKEAIA